MKIIKEIYAKYKKTVILSLSFLLPAFILLFVYKRADIYPFGKMSLLIMDLNTQYIDFMIYLKRAVSEGGSLIYSWTKGGGGPLIDLFAYYLSSPFNLILLFFPIEKMDNAVLILNILKIGLSGITFSIYMRYILKKWNFMYVMFALFYSLSTYAVAYSMCLMWLDGIILLPIILIGVEKILKEKKCVLFIFSYTLSLISNFYTCFMITLFVVIYFIYRFITTKETKFLKKSSLLAFSGISSFLMSLWLILPSIENMTYGKFQKGVLVSSSFFTRSAETFFKQIFPAQCNSITYNGGPNIFCGVLCALLVILYFVNNKFSKKERILSFTFILLFTLSFYINKLDIVWHMFQTPTWFPCRYAFLFCFFIIYLSIKSLNTLSDVKYKRIVLSGLILLSIYIATVIFLNRLIPNPIGTYIGISLAILYTVLIILYRFGFRKLTVAVLLLVSLVEISVNSSYTVANLNKVFKYKEKSEFENYISQLSDDIEELKEKDNSFYRIEKDFCRTENDSMALNYNGIAHYSSSYNADFNKAMKRMGLEQSFIILDSSGITPVFNMLFGVKYFFSKNPQFYDFYETEKICSDYTILKNPYSLPIGFVLKDDITNIKGFGSDYIKNQNILTKALCDIKCFYEVDYKKTSDTTFEFTADNNYPIYFSIPKKQKGIKNITVNGKKIDMPTYTESCIFPIGRFEKGDKIAVTLKNAPDSFNPYFLCTEDLESIYHLLMQPFIINDYSETSLDCSISTNRSGTVFTTINYDKNWHITINGKEVKQKKVMDAFIGFDLPEADGEYHVVFTYKQTTFYIGVLISLLTFASLIILFICTHKKKIYKQTS